VKTCTVKKEGIDVNGEAEEIASRRGEKFIRERERKDRIIMTGEHKKDHTYQDFERKMRTSLPQKEKRSPMP